MKFIIFVIVFVLVIIYYKKNCVNSENFADTTMDPPSYYQNINQYKIEDVDKVGPFYIDGNKMLAPPNDLANSSLYKDMYWEIKPAGFSDIFNDENSNIKQFQCDKMLLFQNQPQLSSVNMKGKGKEGFENKELSSDPNTKVGSGQFPGEIEVEKKIYKILGFAINQYYEQYYLIYEHEVNDKVKDPEVANDLKYLNFKLYSYALVKIHNNVPQVMHKVGPREKIKINDFVYLSLGVFQLGPLKILPPS
jgi:hypothetical protein